MIFDIIYGDSFVCVFPSVSHKDSDIAFLYLQLLF